MSNILNRKQRVVFITSFFSDVQIIYRCYHGRQNERFNSEVLHYLSENRQINIPLIGCQRLSTLLGFRLL